jgi:hypothetical protein
MLAIMYLEFLYLRFESLQPVASQNKARLVVQLPPVNVSGQRN